ncbi:MAG: DUF1702 family protein [Phycisphaerales bacterium]|nr:MAG: DUF1702 family protein [Phycisphaerales bacterium]
MGVFAYIGVIAILTLGVAVATGWWRRLFAAFAIRPAEMTVERLGLLVATSQDTERVNTILRSFAGGFNAMITRASVAASHAYSDSLPVFYRPFAEEGLAMGYTLRHLFRYNPTSFELNLVKARPHYRYLYYVGLGFWSGMRNHSAERVARLTEGLDPLHRYLCFDGYGFKHAFFDYPKDPQILRRLDALEGYVRKAAYQGVGRGMWFLFAGHPEVLIEHIAKLGEHAGDGAAGLGLASVFVNPDRLEVAQELGKALPAEWHNDYHLGMCFGLKARALNDLDHFQQGVGRLPRAVQDAVYASIRECDRVELLIRSEGEEDGYRRWRGRVTAWMAENIEYPLAGIVQSESERLEEAATSAPRRRA